MQSRLEHFRVDAGADDAALMSRTLGVLLLCGGLIVLASTALSRPEQAAAGLYTVVATALALGCAALLFSRHARTWTGHSLFAAGSGLICLGTYFASAPTGLYAVLLVWLAIAAATSFSARVARWDGRESAGELLVRADLAMYEAKARSRPRGAVRPPDLPGMAVRSASARARA